MVVDSLLQYYPWTGIRAVPDEKIGLTGAGRKITGEMHSFFVFQYCVIDQQLVNIWLNSPLVSFISVTSSIYCKFIFNVVNTPRCRLF